MSKNFIRRYRIRLLFYLPYFALLFLPSLCFAQEIREIPEFTKNDRILILAPHPDDESIGTAGVIQRALKKGAKVKVVCYTNGDHNELAFIVYEKRIVLRKRAFIYMGEVRRKETLAAMNSLGLRQEDCIFLGYPDFGTMEILTKYWGKTKPFRYLLTRISRVPYIECLSLNAPYVGESILNDIKKVILDFKPTKVFVSHPADTNRDHKSLYLFLQVALWDLEGQLKQPKIFPYIIHVVGWPEPRGYHPELKLNPPSKKSIEILWQKLTLSDEEIQAKHKAISFYKSQNKASPKYLFTFARKNELFEDFSIIKLQKQKTEEILWEEHKTGQNSQENVGEKKQNSTGFITTLGYAYNDQNFYLKLPLKNKIDKELGISIFLLGYNKKIDFSKMPKIKLYIDIFGLRIKEKKQSLFIKDVQLKYKKGALILKIPLSVLGSPHYILTSTKTNRSDLPFEDTNWRIVELE